MKMPPRSSIVATIVAVLIAAPFLLMYARWRSIWIYPGVACLALAAVWRLLWYPRSGYISLACAGAGLLAGIALGLLAAIPFAAILPGIKMSPKIIRIVCMFHGAWLGLLCGLFAGYYMHLRRVFRAAAPAVALAPSPPAPEKK